MATEHTQRGHATGIERLAYDTSNLSLYTPEIRDTVFQAEVSYSLLQIGAECARLAYFRAEESLAEYHRLEQALARIGFGPPTLFKDVATGTEAFASWRSSDATALIAFRGTRPDDIADLGTNMNVSAVLWPESAGCVHGGFAAATRAVLPKLSHWLQLQATRASEVVFTGHSLGAALATLAGSVLRPTLLVSLGSPRIGDRSFAGSLAALRFCRVVNCCDVVTDSPPEMPLYTHGRPPLYITREALLVHQIDDRAMTKDRMRARFDYLRSEAWRPGAVPLRDLADHSPINYVRAFFPCRYADSPRGTSPNNE